MTCAVSSNHSRKSSRSLRLRSRNLGIALVSVLWLLLLLSGLAATVSYIARVNAMLARHAFDLARAQAAADAAIVNTISRLADEQASRHPQLGVSESWTFDSMPVTVVVSSEGGRIDVNTAGDELLRAFMQTQGISADIASTLLQQLRAWQGIVTGTTTNSSVRSRSLETIDELRELPGWREQNLNCWSATLTVYSGRPDVAVPDATPGALAALEWLRAHSVDHANRTASADPLTATTTGTASSVPRDVLDEVIRIRASATANDVNTTSEWIGRVTGDSSLPALTMRWDHDVYETAAPSCGKTS
jgi:type II secretory pathway component PulK